jgi:tartrate dehydrogenase/decarboxylase / D-malate dehydrogenase
MQNYRIAVIPGDGIGGEVTPVGVKVLQAAGRRFDAYSLDLEWFDWGCGYYLEHGRMMPADGLDILRHFDAIYFGACGFPTVPDHVSLRGLRLPICQGFDQYVCLRPARLLPGVPSPLARVTPGALDLIVVRENTEGLYAGVGGRSHRGQAGEVAMQTQVFTRHGVERIIRYAFDLARRRPRRHLTSATKSNACQYSFVMWDEIFAEVAEEYPDVTTDAQLIDALAARCVTHPESLDVIVASNLFGDILSDLTGALAGSLGLAASTNINPTRQFPSMFEPVHGSAPDIAGRGIANPMAAIWSGALMMEFLGHPDVAEKIVAAIEATTAAGVALTPDLGGKASTEAVGDAVMSHLA